MTVISRIQRRSRGSRLSAIAMLVSGPIGGEDQLLLVLLGHRDDEVDRVRGDRLAHRLRHLRAVEAGLAVPRRDADGRLHQRLGTAGRERDVEAAELERDQSVARRVLERVVAVHRRNADEIQVARREQDRDEIVMAGIAIDEYFLFRQDCLAGAGGTQRGSRSIDGFVAILATFGAPRLTAREPLNHTVAIA